MRSYLSFFLVLGLLVACSPAADTDESKDSNSSMSQQEKDQETIDEDEVMDVVPG